MLQKCRGYDAKTDIVFVVCFIFVPQTVRPLPKRFSFKILLKKSTSLFEVLLLLTGVRKKKRKKHCHK